MDNILPFKIIKLWRIVYKIRFFSPDEDPTKDTTMHPNPISGMPIKSFRVTGVPRSILAKNTLKAKPVAPNVAITSGGINASAITDPFKKLLKSKNEIIPNA